jgi:hypothetical protein
MTPSCQRRLFTLLAALALVSGCSSTQVSSSPRGVTGNVANTAASVTQSILGGKIIPDATIGIGPSVAYPLEKLVYWGVWVGAAWLILDPLAPNWEIQEARLPENHFHFQMTMKRYYAGGAGEARQVFNRRARELMRAGGFSGYEIVEYAEGIDSSLLGSQRTVEGVIRLTKLPA